MYLICQGAPECAALSFFLLGAGQQGSDDRQAPWRSLAVVWRPSRSLAVLASGGPFWRSWRSPGGPWGALAVPGSSGGPLAVLAVLGYFSWCLGPAGLGSQQSVSLMSYALAWGHNSQSV